LGCLKAAGVDKAIKKVSGMEFLKWRVHHCPRELSDWLYSTEWAKSINRVGEVAQMK